MLNPDQAEFTSQSLAPPHWCAISLWTLQRVRLWSGSLAPLEVMPLCGSPGSSAPPAPIRRWGLRTRDADQRCDRPGNSPGETETPFLRRACWPHSAHRHQWISLIPSKAFESDDEHFLAFQPSNTKKWAHWILCQCKLYIPRGLLDPYLEGGIPRDDACGYFP